MYILSVEQLCNDISLGFRYFLLYCHFLGYFGTSWVNSRYDQVVNNIYSDNGMAFKCKILRLTFWFIGLSAFHHFFRL
jgi:hypothetical protein